MPDLQRYPQKDVEDTIVFICRETTHENKQFKETKQMKIKFILDQKKTFKGTVVNRIMPSWYKSLVKGSRLQIL